MCGGRGRGGVTYVAAPLVSPCVLAVATPSSSPTFRLRAPSFSMAATSACCCYCAFLATTCRCFVRHTDKLHFCLLACLLLRRGHQLRTLGVVGVRGAHREGRGGRTSTTHTTGVARRIMRAIDPPLRAGAGDVLRVDGRELRTLGVVGVHGAARGDEHGVVAVWAAVRECISSPKRCRRFHGQLFFF
jgi:hypothetical protein